MNRVHPIFQPLLDAIAPPMEHKCTIKNVGEYEIQPVCSCGWEGRKQHRVSCDYAWTNAQENFDEHIRKIGRK